MDFLSAFGTYDYLIRNSMILLLIVFSMYLLLNAGLFAVPQIGFMAIGSYVAAVLATKSTLPVPMILLLCVLGASAAGLLLGLVLARLNGIYLAIATIAFSEVVRVSARNLDVTGGVQGIVGIFPPPNDLVICAAAAIVFVSLVCLARSRQGRVIRGIREDPLMAAHQGVNVRRYRLALFVAAGALSGLSGGLHAYFNGFVVPGTYTFDLLNTLLAAAVLGGMTSAAGPVLGSLVVFALPQLLSGVAEYRNVVYGALIIAVMAFSPRGLAHLLEICWRRFVPARVGSRPASADPEPPLPSHDDSSRREAVLRIVGFSKHFGGVKAVNDVSIDIRAGEILGLIGPNGSGKTTVLNLISGVYAPAAGTLVAGQDDLAAAFGRPHRIARAGIARTFQNIRLLGDESVYDNVMLGTYLLARDAGAEDAVWRTIDELGLAEVAHLRVGSLPYGTQRKVEIARAMVRQPAVLLLDEPTAGMTPIERGEIFELSRTIARRGVAVVIVEHDVASITSYCERLAVLDFGKLIALGPASEVVREEAVVDAYFGAHIGS